MAQNAPQPDDASPSAATLPDSARAAGDEKELLDVLADQMVDQILSEQAAELTGPVPGFEGGELIEAAATDLQEPAATSDRPHADVASDAPDEQYVTSEEMDALFGPSAESTEPEVDQTGESALQGEPEPLRKPAKHAATPAARGPVSQADLDALFEQVAGQSDEPSAEPNSATAPGEAGQDTSDDEAMSQGDLDALFSAEGDQTQAEADELDAGDAESTAATEGDKLSSEQLDDLLSQAADDAGADSAVDADDLEAVLERQQADHPDPVARPSAALSPAEAVGGGEAQALRTEQPRPEPNAAPVASMDDVDALLAERAEQGAAAADIASDPALSATGDDDSSTEAEAIAVVDMAYLKPPVVERADPMGDADPIEGTAKPRIPFMVPDKPDESAGASEPAAEFSPGMRGAFIRLLDRINAPFADLSPDTRDVLGYVAIALIGLSLMLAFKSLLG